MSPPGRFENYEIISTADGAPWELGRGAMGVTYKALDIDLHCEVALKVINPALVADPEVRERFLKEARAAARLRHPNIASVFRLGTAPSGELFYAMEFCSGPTLDQAIAADGPMAPAAALDIVLQVSKALALAEQHQLVHRDLKPSNLILTESPAEGRVVKMIDFGLARSFAEEIHASSSRIRTGFAGTAHFASPEQLEELDLDIRSDIYSLGTCLWFMLMGRPPFEGSTARVMSQTLSAEPPWERLSEQPPVVLDLLERMLAKDRDQRPAGATALKELIESTLARLSEVVPEAALPAHPVSFTERFVLTVDLGEDSLGHNYQASDLTRSGLPVRVRHIDPSLTAVPSIAREIEAQLRASVAFPHENLLSPVDFGWADEGLLIATEWISGFTLLDLLKRRSALSAAETCTVLSHLAAVADHAHRHGLHGLNLSKDEIQFHFPDLSQAGGVERLGDEPLSRWPSHRILAGCLRLDDGLGDAMTTLSPGVTHGGDFSPVTSIAQIACEMMGGRGGQQFAPLPRLNEEGNAVLRLAFQNPAAFMDAGQLVATLQATLGDAPPASPPPPPAPLPVASHQELQAEPALMGPPSGKRKGLPTPLWIMLGLAGLGSAYLIVQHLPKEEKASNNSARTTDRTPAPAPKKAPALPPSTPAAPAAAKTASVDLSPQYIDEHSARWEELAAQGNAFAQVEQGMYLIRLDSTEKDAGRALLEKAAAQKHPLGIFLAAEQELADLSLPFDTPIPAVLDRKFRDAFAKGLSSEEPGDVAIWMAALGRAYDRGMGTAPDHGLALKYLGTCADNVSDWATSCRYLLGQIYENGRGVPKSRAIAAKHYEEAALVNDRQALEDLTRLAAYGPLSLALPDATRQRAEELSKKGDATAQLLFGLLLDAGIGGKKNPVLAHTYYEESAKQNNPGAKAQLARYALSHPGETHDDARTLQLLQEAYDGGAWEACSDLGRLYEKGLAGEKPDMAKAFELYRKGALAGDMRSKIALAVCLDEGHGAMTDPVTAFELFDEAARDGIPEGIYRSGLAQIHGRGTTRNPKAGALTVKKAGDLDFTPAIFEWGRCLELGIGVKKNLSAALDAYINAMSLGHPEATFRIALMEEEGRGLKRNEAKARIDYETAANAGWVPAMVNLGLLYARGLGGAMDEAKALSWYAKAAAANDADALVLLGMMNEFGRGVPKSPSVAADYYRKAAALGDSDATERLKKLSAQ